MIGKHVELPAMRADGSVFPVELSIIQIPHAGPPLFTGFIRDLTEYEQAITAERKRIARELHDSLAHVLGIGSTPGQSTEPVVHVSPDLARAVAQHGMLTAREQSAPALIVQGVSSNRELAAQLGVGEDIIRPAHRLKPDQLEIGIRLTVREQSILRQLAEGLTQEEIARIEGLSLRTVQRVVNTLQQKLDAPTQFLLGSKAYQHGLLRI